MTVTDTVTYEYEIEDSIIEEYLSKNKKDINFYNFMEWLDTNYTLGDFCSENIIYGEYSSVNGITRCNDEFLKEVNRIRKK